MRRISSLFRSKHNDAGPPLIIPSSPSTPLLTTSSHPSHSSASSSGSASVRTPDDDPNSRFHPKKSWLPSWLSPKRSGTLKRSAEFDDQPQRSDFVLPHDSRVANPPLLHTHDIDDNSSEDSEDDDDDDENENDTHHHDGYSVPPSSRSTAMSPALQKSCKHFENLISSSLSPSPSPSSPPLYHFSGTYMFPRSSNVSRLLPCPDSLRVTMLKSHLLHLLKHTPTISSSDARLLASFGSRPVPIPTQRPSLPIDDHAVDVTRLSSTSPGLRRWVTRPCFEDRFIVWLPSQDSSTLVSRPVTGSGYAVAELEVSEAIETLACLDLVRSSLPQEDFNPLILSTDQQEHSETSSTSSSSSSSSSSLSMPSAPRNAPYKATPSPLRIQHGPSSSQNVPLSLSNDSSSQISTAPPNAEPEIQPTPAKRGVRFAEDGKEDQIPLAYVLRIKKQREEKARFLREERERRTFEEERHKQEMERMERERERREWERERKVWEMEKRAMEEERKARLYAEEIAASRLRRESVRAGGNPAMHLNAASSSPLPSSREPNDRRHDSRGYSRPVYDSQRRQASDQSMTTIDTGVRTGGSRPSSTGHGGGSPSGSGSRPASVYSAHTLSSSEDGRLRDAAAANGSIRSKKRGSIGSLSSQRPPSEHRASSHSGFDSVPPVPPIPQPYAMDVPLLPPTAPFMMHRPRSSHSSSSGSSKQRLPRNDSADRIGATQPRRDNVSASPHRERDDYRRRSSGDTFTSSDRGRTSIHARSQPNSYSRGTLGQIGMFTPPQGPTFIYPQSPWTALPTMAQLQQQVPMTFNGGPPLVRRPAAIS